VIEDCTFAPEVAPNNAFNRRIEFRNCRFLARQRDDGSLLAASYEIDKLIEQLTFDERCEFMGNVTSRGGGVLELDQRGRISGFWEGVPRAARFDCAVGDRIVLTQGVAAAHPPLAFEASASA
jgi:hypothetical protein